MFYIIQKKYEKVTSTALQFFVLVIKMSKPFMLLLKVHKYNNNNKKNPRKYYYNEKCKVKVENNDYVPWDTHMVQMFLVCAQMAVSIERLVIPGLEYGLNAKS